MIAKYVTCGLMILGMWVGSARAGQVEGERADGLGEEQKLGLRAPERMVPNFRLEVGANVGVAVEERGWSGRDFINGLPTNVSEDVRFVREMVVRGRSAWDAMLAEVEMRESERPWSTTSMVNVPLSLRAGGSKVGDVVPFFSLASEQHVVRADAMRFGAGGGAMMRLGRNTKIGVDAVYLGGTNEGGDDSGSELRVMGRLEWGF